MIRQEVQAGGAESLPVAQSGSTNTEANTEANPANGESADFHSGFDQVRKASKSLNHMINPVSLISTLDPIRVASVKFLSR